MQTSVRPKPLSRSHTTNEVQAQTLTMQQANLFVKTGLVAGVDEAGRGPLAGPVTAAAVILHPDRPVTGLADSKKLSPRKRESLAAEIRVSATAWSVAWADPAEIDAMNILAATMLAMRRAILGLPIMPAFVQVDGNRLPDLNFGAMQPVGEAVVGGDDRIAAISAASILAKTDRDQRMRDLDRLYPCYEFGRHKGYGTRVHKARLEEFGPCCEHRHSFAPVRAAS